MASHDENVGIITGTLQSKVSLKSVSAIACEQAPGLGVWIFAGGRG